MRKGKNPDSDPYLWLMDPDPGGPKTSGSGSGFGPGSPKLWGELSCNENGGKGWRIRGRGRKEADETVEMVYRVMKRIMGEEGENEEHHTGEGEDGEGKGKCKGWRHSAKIRGEERNERRGQFFVKDVRTGGKWDWQTEMPDLLCKALSSCFLRVWHVKVLIRSHMLGEAFNLFSLFGLQMYFRCLAYKCQ